MTNQQANPAKTISRRTERLLAAKPALKLTPDRRGHFVTQIINDSGDFYAVHLCMNSGTEEWFVTLRADSGIELENVGLFASFDRAAEQVAESLFWLAANEAIGDINPA